MPLERHPAQPPRPRGRVRLFLDHRRALTRVRGERRDDRRREHEDRAGQERPLVAVSRRLGDRVVAGVLQRVGASGGERGEDRQTERGAELLAGVQEPGGEAGLVLVDAGVRRRRGAREDAAQADRGDHEAGQDVRDVRAVDRDPREPVEAAGRDQGADEDDRLGADAGEQLRGDAGRDDEAAGQRQVGDARLDRRVVQHGLHVEREEEEHRAGTRPPPPAAWRRRRRCP